VIVTVDESPEVVAVIPTLGHDRPRLERCVAALRAQTSTARLAIVVVLNAPASDAMDFRDFDDCTLLRPGLNLGWAGGLHLGRYLAPDRGRLWLVQDDMAPEPGCLDALQSALDVNPQLAIASPVVLDADDLVTAGSCGGVLRWEPEIEIDHWYPRAAVSVAELDGLDRLDYVPSRGMLVDLGAWDAIGGMFPGYYPVLWADVDVCTAVRAQGLRFAIVTEAVTRHDGQGSTPGTYGRFLFERHRLLFDARWRSGSVPSPREATPLPPALTIAIATAAASLASDLAVDRTRLMAAHDPLVAENAALRHDLGVLRASTSWRVTGPLRALSRLLRRRR
jgi:GT2 family glycosyltransferase